MKKYFLFIYISGIAASGFAQTADPELKDLVNKSFDYFPKLDELEKNVDIQEQKIEVAKTYLLPGVNLNAGYNYLAPVSEAEFPSPSGGLQEFKFQPNNNFNSSLGINYVFLDFGRAKAAIDKTKQELQLSRDNLDFNKTQIAAQVANVYYGVIYLQRAIAVEDSVIERLQENKTVVENKIKNGDALQLDLFNMNGTIDAEKNRRADLSNQLQKQFNTLNYLSGTAENRLSDHGFNFTILIGDEASLLKAATEQNFDFKLIRDKVQIAQRDEDLAGRQFYPTVSLNAGAGFRNGYVPDINSVQFNYVVGVSLNMPLYSGGRLREQEELSGKNVELNELTNKTLEANYRKDIQQSLTDIASLNERIANTQAQILQANEAYKMTESGYRNGVITHIELINALTNVQRSELSQIQLQYQLCLANVELARLTGEEWWK